MGYGGGVAPRSRWSPAYIGKILKGAKPVDLPIQQSTKVELVINLKTANALGLKIPVLMLAQADEVIEIVPRPRDAAPAVLVAWASRGSQGNWFRILKRESGTWKIAMEAFARAGAIDAPPAVSGSSPTDK